MGVNITIIDYLRVLIIEIGSTISLMVVEAQGVYIYNIHITFLNNNKICAHIKIYLLAPPPPKIPKEVYNDKTKSYIHPGQSTGIPHMYGQFFILHPGFLCLNSSSDFQAGRKVRSHMISRQKRHRVKCYCLWKGSCSTWDVELLNKYIMR